MDTTTSHILTKLDAIERAIGELRRESPAAASPTSPMQDIQPRAKTAVFRVKSWPPFWQNLAAGVLIWTFGISVSAYLKRGGDPLAIIDLLLKLAL